MMFMQWPMRHKHTTYTTSVHASIVPAVKNMFSDRRGSFTIPSSPTLVDVDPSTISVIAFHCERLPSGCHAKSITRRCTKTFPVVPVAFSESYKHTPLYLPV